MRNIKVLIAAPVHQDKETFVRYLDSLDNLKTKDYVNISRAFILDNCSDEVKNLYRLQDDNTLLIVNDDNVEYKRTNVTHEWNIHNLNKVVRLDLVSI